MKDQIKKTAAAATLAVLAVLASFMPETTDKIAAQLNTTLRDIDSLDTFGLYADGTKVIEKPEMLFARLDADKVMERVEEIKAAQKAEAGVPEYPKVEKKPEITLEDFDKVQIQVGEVLKCEKVKKAKKLLCSQIRVGDEVRQIVSGISLHYTPEEMVGKKVAVITNLKPAKLCGLLSEGMILAAADDDGNMSVLTLDKDIISGSEIC